MSNTISPEIRRQPKKSLGYGATFSCARIQPVTGREWVYTATEDQMKVLYEIEDLWAGLVPNRYHFIFREVHGIPGDPDFDGWTISMREIGGAKSSWKRFRGFPPSAHFVLSALQKMYAQFVAREEAADGESV